MSSEAITSMEKRERRRRQKQREIVEAIASADEPPTHDEIRLRTFNSTRTVRWYLTQLIEDGKVRRFRDQDDRRVFRYELAEGGSE